MDFNPYTQNVSFLAPDGLSHIDVPIPLINQWNDESVNIAINYASQIGACAALLAVVLLATPPAKLLRPSAALHLLGLLVCLVRVTLLSVYFVSPFNHFYEVWGQDYSRVPPADARVQVAATVFSLLLVVAVELALVNQAWTMVSLWPGPAKYAVCALSGLVTLMTAGFRLAFTVVQTRDIMGKASPERFAWLANATLVTNALSVFWFCLVFNLKLVTHLVSNRRVLPSHRSMSPMEILVMTNGILMMVPVLFAGLEFGRFDNFEAGSLTLTSVAIILPLGTLAAQRMAQAGNATYLSDFSSSSSAAAAAAASAAAASAAGGGSSSYSRYFKSTSASSTAPLKGACSPFSTTTSTSTSSTITPHPSSVPSRCCEEGIPAGVVVLREVIDPVDLELRHIDGYLEPKEAVHGMKAETTTTTTSTEQFHR